MESFNSSTIAPSPILAASTTDRKQFTTASCAVVVVTGLFSHRLYFIKGEHHLRAPTYFRLWIALSLVAVLISFSLDEHGLVRLLDFDHQAWIDAAGFSAITNIAFFGSLFGSMVMYRSYLHPLKSFPGPRFARVSKLWHLGNMFRIQNHLFLENLRQKYGDVVRTGPQELTIFDPAVYNIISGPGTTCIKSPWYDMLNPLIAINSIREKEGYGLRRKQWDQALALNGEALQKNVDIILYYCQQLSAYLAKHQGNPINMTEWFYFFSFDTMGAVAFGKSFSMLDNGQDHYAPRIMSQGMSMLQYFSPVPWLAHMCFGLPFIAHKWNKAIEWARTTLNDRVKAGTTQQDVFSRFIRAAKSDSGEDFNLMTLYGDAFGMTVAGSHTTATTLTMLFHELASAPEIQTRLRTELASLEDPLDPLVLKELPLLNACINEILRLHPQLPTGGIRQTTDVGINIGKHHIPPHTIIVSPRYSISRLESAFERPNDFVPERWTSKPEMIKDRRAFVPFNIGRHTCPGRHLGMLEVRLMTAILLTRFQVTLEPSKENKRRAVTDMRDAFTATPGRVDLIFSPIQS